MAAISDSFRAATGDDRYPYLRRLAESDVLPQVLHIPTGADKTAAVTQPVAGCQLALAPYRARRLRNVSPR